MAILKIKTEFPTLTSDLTKSFLISDAASGVTTISVQNIQNFSTSLILLIGELGSQGSEIIKTSTTVSPSGNTITLATATTQPHASGAYVYVLDYDQILISSSATATGVKTALATISITPDQLYTQYNDTTAATGYRFAQFNNSTTNLVSVYSDPIPVTGYTVYSARSIIDKALSEMNKTTNQIFNDDYAFQQLDNFQMDVLREQKRWSFMQSFNTNIGSLSTGGWTLTLPTNVDDQNTNKSIYRLKLGKLPDLVWVDNEKFNQLIADLGYTTLANNIIVGATSIVLTSSVDFGTSGNVTIGANTYAFTANNTTTNTLTIAASTTTNTAGEYVFINPSVGMPNYWTSFNSTVFVYPILGSQYSPRNAYMDYYKSLTRITTDTQEIVIPDSVMAQEYLMWKFLVRQNNGSETEGSAAHRDSYIARREKLKQKDVLNRNFRLRPRFNDWSKQMQWDEGDSREIRDGNFPNTGF